MKARPHNFTRPDYSIETGFLKKSGGPVAGVDEAGRGPWAGPVVAAAVVLCPDNIPDGLNDSKKLTAARREQLYAAIMENSLVAIGVADVETIDRDNILQATLGAMQRAVAALARPPAMVLVDGNHCPRLSCPVQALVGGDRLSLSIAAASIIAKVTRDRIMQELAREFPCYHFDKHKGYGTKAHLAALEEHGATRHHRRSFKPVRRILERERGR